MLHAIELYAYLEIRYVFIQFYFHLLLKSKFWPCYFLINKFYEPCNKEGKWLADCLVFLAKSFKSLTSWSCLNELKLNSKKKKKWFFKVSAKKSKYVMNGKIIVLNNCKPSINLSLSWFYFFIILV